MDVSHPLVNLGRGRPLLSHLSSLPALQLGPTARGTMTRWVAALLCLGVLAGSLAGCSTVPKSFSPAEPINHKDFSHQALDKTLRVNVADGVVNYTAIAVDSNFRPYLEQLDRIDPTSLPTQRD